MKYQKILGLVATAGLLMAGCATDSDNNNTWLSDSNAVHVSASVGSIFTRSNPAASDEDKQMSFNSGDVMGVSNNGTSITYTYNKGTNDWQPGSGSYLVWDASDLTFQCWYPAACKNTYSKGYIQEDQSSTEMIAKSDYMKAEVTTLTKIPDSRQLDVTLVRKTARLILNIQNFNDQFDASTTKVNHIRIASKASTNANETTIINIKPLQKGEGGIGTTYTALVMPGTIEANLYFSTDEATETPLVVKTGALEAGKSYTYNLIVGKNKVTIGNVTVADWGKGDIDGGKAFYAPYVTFTAEQPQTFKMTTEGNYNISDLEYSVNNGKWQNVEKGIPITFGGTNGTLRLRGTNINGTASRWNAHSTITFTDPNVEVACTGDIRTLLDWRNYSTVDTQNARFCRLFNECKVLTSAPDLPATTLADACYFEVFYGCTKLTSAPVLPATTLAETCYQAMFFGCTSLEKAPELKATELVYCCYEGMFKYCTKLSTVTMLAPSDQIFGNTGCCTDWLNYAGIDTNITSRTLKVQDRDAYTALKNKTDYLPTEWQIGSNCTVLDKDGNAITE